MSGVGWFVLGLVLRSLYDIATEWRDARLRRGVFPENYHDVCGGDCNVPRTMAKGNYQLRENERVQNVADRLHRQQVTRRERK